MGLRQQWQRALDAAAQRGQLPPEVVSDALESMGVRPEADLTPALIAFWVDLAEHDLAVLLHEVQAAEAVGVAAATQSEHPTAKAPAAWAPGQTLGEFELLEQLGQGGMGQVFRARQRSLARDVALKVLAPGLVGDPESQRRFLREARALAAVNDPHVVTCYQAGEIDGALFISMELLSGGDVTAQAKAAKGGRLPERRVLDVAVDMARGLVALESAGLVHRDIKPQNLFLDAEGRVKLGDLGLARQSNQADRITLTGFAAGTPPFMSPEQLDGKAELDARSDVYATGATLYTLLTGRAPRVGQGPPTGLQRELPELSARTVSLIRRAMEVEPERRYPSAGALLEATLAARDALRRPSGRRIGVGKRSSEAEARRATPAGRLVPLGIGALLVALLGGAAAIVTSNPTPAAVATGDDAVPEPPAVEPSAEPVPAAEPPPRPSPVEPEPVGSETKPEPGSEPEPVGPETEPEPEPDSTQDPEPPPVRPEPLAAEPPAEPSPWRLARVRVSPENGVLSRDAGGTYVARPAGPDWSRSGVFTTEPLALPARVRWTCRAEATRDASAVADWERQHGFREPAGFFFELAVRTEPRPIESAREMNGAALWVGLQYCRDGRILGMLRAITEAKPPGVELVAVPGAGAPLTPGVAILDRFTLRNRPAHDLHVVLELDARGYQLSLEWDDSQRPAESQKGRWGREGAPPAPQLQRELSLWGHLGKWSNGAGAGSLRTELGR